MFLIQMQRYKKKATPLKRFAQCHPRALSGGVTGVAGAGDAGDPASGREPSLDHQRALWMRG